MVQPGYSLTCITEYRYHLNKLILKVYLTTAHLFFSKSCRQLVIHKLKHVHLGRKVNEFKQKCFVKVSKCDAVGTLW